MAGRKSPLIPRLAAPLAFALAFALPLGLPAQAGADAAAEAPGIAGPYLAAEAAARRGDVAAAARWYADALEADPSNRTLLSKAIVHLVGAGQAGRAVPLAERLEATEPGHHLGVLMLAVEALRTGDPAAARARLASAEDGSGPFVGQLISAWAAFAAGDAAAARDSLARLEEGDAAGAAGNIVAAYHQALLEAAAGRDAEALTAIDHAIASADGATGRLIRVRAGILARLGRLDEARAAVDESLAATLGDPRLERLADDLANGRVPPPLVTTGAQGAAEALFGVSGFLLRGPNRQIGLAYARLAVLLDPDLAEGWLLIGDILNEGGQHELATVAYDAVPRDAPEALEAAIGRARALEAADRRDEGIGVLRETAAAQPRALEAQLGLGDMLRRAERWAEAADAYDAALRLIDRPEQRHWALYYQRGIAYERSDQWDKAEADFLKALELEPDQPLVLNYLGYSWVEQRKNLDEARAMIEQAVEQRPEDGYIVDSLGWVLYRLGEFEEAAAHLERAVELLPTDPVINDHYGDALWMIGRKTEARFQWKRSISFEPEEKDAERIAKKLRQGLDAVVAEETAAGEPAVIKSTAGAAKPNGG
ncbi:MAG TPA: tetratricopeptide repeat protein [Thermohalobaculum sp.]|nr:tetratricopeptide repeat protein [Thermohalobaculum sp.]